MIDKDIISEMVHRKMLYQDQRKNCVFVSYKIKKQYLLLLEEQILIRDM